MIVTLTANPSNDRAVRLPGPLARGEVIRVASATVDPGGKGVNVARAALQANVDALAILPAAETDPFPALLTAHDIPHETVPVEQPIRTNLTLTEPDGTTTKLNEPGPTLDHESVAELVAAVVRAGATARWIVLSGSLPPGAPASLYADITAALADADCRVAVDTSGPPLQAVTASSHPPTLVKPNGEELAEVVGGDPSELEADPAAAARAARQLVDGGIAHVLVTLGATGSVHVDDHGATFAPSPPVDVASTVGAGDSALAGWILADLAGHDTATCLRWATAWGAAAVQLPGTQLPTPADTDPDGVSTTHLST